MHKKFILLSLFGVLFLQGFTLSDGSVVKICAYSLKSGDSSSGGSSGGSSSGDWGHSWISIVNVSNSTQKVSAYYLKAGQGMTISAWNNKEPHKGVWMNIEHLYPSSKHISTMDIDLNAYQLSRISTYIDENNKWDLWNTCANFTSNIWNLFATKEDNIQAGWIGTPNKLYESINSKRIREIGRSYPANPDMGYIEGNEFKYHNPESFIGMEVVRI